LATAKMPLYMKNAHIVCIGPIEEGRLLFLRGSKLKQKRSRYRGETMYSPGSCTAYAFFDLNSEDKDKGMSYAF